MSGTAWHRDRAAAEALLDRLAPGASPGAGQVRRMLRLARRAGAALGVADGHARATFPAATLPYQLAVIAEALDAEARRMVAPAEASPRPRHAAVAAPADHGARGAAASLPGTYAAQLVPVHDVNAATAATLAALPGLGPVSARRVVAHRRAHGPFSAVEDARRAGRVSARQWRSAAPRLYAGDGRAPAAETEAARDLRRGGAAAAVALLHAGDLHLPGVDPAGPVEAALGFTAHAVEAIEAHSPYPRHWGPDRERLRRGAAALRADRARRRAQAPARVAVVRGADYLDVARSVIDGAAETVDLAMFFLAASDPDGPAATLTAALGRAARRGVRVRALLDDDLPGDYHGARLINREARERLDAANVDHRSAPPDRTLHAKVLVADGRRLLAGSHNWTASSFYRYDDTSLYIESESAAAAASARLERWWEAAHPDPAQRRVSVLDLEWFTPWERRVLAASGIADHRALEAAGRRAAGRRELAVALRTSEERVHAAVRIARLLDHFPCSETTAVALVASGLDAPSEVRRASRARIEAALADRAALPQPFAGHASPPGVAEWLASIDR